MRVFLALLILIFNFQSWTKADDIRDFEIEGISIGDSLLDYFSSKEIVELKNYYSGGYIFSSKKFYSITFVNHNEFSKYEDLQFILKDNDINYNIYAIQGIINYTKISNCIKELKNIEIDLDKIFTNSQKINRNKLDHRSDLTGKATIERFGYFIGNNTIMVSCADYLDNEKFNIKDALRVAIRTEEFNRFLSKN